MNGSRTKVLWYLLSRRSYIPYKLVPVYTNMISTDTQAPTQSTFNRYFSSDLLSNKNMTVGQCVLSLTTSFQDEGISEPQCSAEYIVAHVLKRKTLCGISRNQLLDEVAMTKISYYADLRLQQIPIQYVIGEWDFRNLTLTCSPPVFIPRPETEELVGHVLSDSVIHRSTHMLEVGCGTGAISIFLLTQIPQLKATAVDINSEACKLTSENARNCNVGNRLNIVHAKFKTGISLNDLKLEDKVDFLISNPPYVRQQDMNNLQPEVKLFEDHRALNGGMDGLSVIRCILEMAKLLIKPQGSVWLEVDPSHPEIIKNIIQSTSSLGLHYEKTHVDFSNRPRFCHIQVKR